MAVSDELRSSFLKAEYLPDSGSVEAIVLVVDDADVEGEFDKLGRSYFSGLGGTSTSDGASMRISQEEERVVVEKKEVQFGGGLL